MKRILKSKIALILVASFLLAALLLPTGCNSGTAATTAGDPVYDGVVAESLVADSITDTGLTPGHIPVTGPDGLLTENEDLSFKDSTLTATNLHAPTGRGVFRFIAAYNASDSEKLQADYVMPTADADLGAVVNSYLALLPPKGGIIQLSTGNFKLSTTIHLGIDADSIWKVIWLRGSGTQATTINLKNSSNCDMIDIISTVSNPIVGFKYVTDMELNGNGTNQTSGNCITYAETSGAIYDAYFERLIVLNSYANGFNISNGWGVHIDNCYAEYCGQDGCSFTGSECYINNSYLSYNTRYGLHIPSVSNLNHFSNLGFLNNGNSHIREYSSHSNWSNILTSGTWGTSHWAILGYGSRNTWNNVHVVGDATTNSRWGMLVQGDYNSINNFISKDVYSTSLDVANGVINNKIINGDVTKPMTDLGITTIIRDITGYIAKGEIRTYSKNIATLTENGITSFDNPFGQDVRVLSLDIYISAASNNTTPNATIDSGIGSSSTTDYATLFENVDCETSGFYNSVNTATVGKQTSPQLWASGSGNRYLNMSIKDAAATGMVATYTVTVMGN
jgi:hypothetical protein